MESEIEGIIREKLRDESSRLVEELKQQVEDSTTRAVERINNVYTSTIKTLEKLGSQDATLLGIFQKTQGNIRVIDVPANPYNEQVAYLEIDGRRPEEFMHSSGIRLTSGKKYRIIMMAMEEEASDVLHSAEQDVKQNDANRMLSKTGDLLCR